MTKKFRLLVKNVAQLVQVTNNHEKFVNGSSMDKISIIENEAMIIDDCGLFHDIGTADYILKKYDSCKNYSFLSILDCKNRQCIVSGLVDRHTHKMGGGINETVKCGRNSSENELLTLFSSRLSRMISHAAHSTASVEVKSSYGLNFESELKMLRAVERCNKIHPIRVVSTYSGAHSVNKKETKNVNKYTNDTIFNQIPKLISHKKQGYINPIMIDVFHEKGVFEYKQATAILKEGIKYGMGINFHGDELHYNKSSELAAELVTDLEHVSDEIAINETE